MKINVEDLTKDEFNERSIIILANGLVQAAGRVAIELGYTLKHAYVSLLTAAEIILIVGNKTGEMSNDEIQTLKDMSIRYAQNYKGSLEKSGIMRLIETLKNVFDRKGNG